MAREQARRPFLFDDELRTALEQIRAAPHTGSAYVARLGREHRRMLLPGTRFHVYSGSQHQSSFESSRSGVLCEAVDRASRLPRSSRGIGVGDSGVLAI
jgi:hypothetical protein